MKTPQEAQLLSTLTLANLITLISTTVQLMSSTHLSNSLNGSPLTAEMIQGISADHVVKSIQQPATTY